MVAPGALIRVAVYDLELSNISDGLGRATTEALLQEVRKLEGVSAIGMDEVREMLDFEAKRRVLGCEADHECLAEIAGALGVDELLIGTLSEQADGRMIILKRVDQRRAQVRATFDKRLVVGNGEEFLLSVGDAIQNLFAERQNRPGTKRGVSEKAVLRLNPPPIKNWMTYTAYGLTAAAAAVTGDLLTVKATRHWIASIALRVALTAKRSTQIPGDLSTTTTRVGRLSTRLACIQQAVSF